MNDATATGIRQSHERPKAQVVDTAIPRAAGVRQDGAGIGTADNESGGEGVDRGVEAEGLTVLVCGGRAFNDGHAVRTMLSGLSIKRLVHGAATGADALASAWAIVNNVYQKGYPANWGAHGKAAGPMRNEQMLREEKPDLVVAFPGGKGTAHMVGIARKAGVRVIEVGKGHMASSCEMNCGYDNGGGKVEFCSPGCREFGAWGRDV